MQYESCKYHTIRKSSIRLYFYQRGFINIADMVAFMQI